MKKVIHFSKMFLPLVILSSLIIISGLVYVVVHGLNYGIDFKPGLIQEVRIAPPAITLTYSGPASVSVQTASHGLSLVISGTGVENTTLPFLYVNYPTLGDLVAALDAVDGIGARVNAPASVPSDRIFSTTDAAGVLSQIPIAFHYVPSDAEPISTDQVRDSLVSVSDSAVKMLGDPQDRYFQIRVGDDGTNTDASVKIREEIAAALAGKFGAENIAVIKTDFIAARFSSSLALQSAILVVLTLGLILLYSTIRFKWDFAAGAVLAIVHDALIMVAFISFTQMEFSSITIAAILTIVGYSINDTIVVLDRVRENLKNPNIKVTSFKEILDISQTEILSRTIITTLTTMLAVISLYIFTTGQMKDFALALLVGMISGVYSTIFITGAFIAAVRKNWKPSDEEKQSPGTLKIPV